MNKCFKNIKKMNMPIIIYGAGLTGEAVYQACKEAGVNVAHFCDDKLGRNEIELYGIEVLSFDEIRSNYKDAIFLIAVSNAKRIGDRLKENGYNQYFLLTDILDDVLYWKFSFSRGHSIAVNEIESFMFLHNSYEREDDLCIRCLDLVITERCSLRCNDCANLMQYYNKPKDYNYDQVLCEFQKLYDHVDEIYEVRILGGEPFMNKQMGQIVQTLSEFPKVRKVVIYTNGTIAPNESNISYFKQDKVLFMITDYAGLSKKIVELQTILARHCIPYSVHSAEGWTDCGKIEQHHRLSEANRELFKQCCARDITTLLKGRLYRCPFMAHSHNLLAVPNCENDYIDLVHMDKNNNLSKSKIKEFLYTQEQFAICDFCNGRNYDAEEIMPAVQAKQPRSYIRYGKTDYTQSGNIG